MEIRGDANREDLIKTFLPLLKKGSHLFRICTCQARPEAALKQKQHDLIVKKVDVLASRMNHGGNWDPAPIFQRHDISIMRYTGPLVTPLI